MRPRTSTLAAARLNAWAVLGWPGVIGMVLMAASVLSVYRTSLMEHFVEEGQPPTLALRSPAAQNESATAVTPADTIPTTWMSWSDTPSLVSAFEDALIEMGLALPSADYRYSPATPQSLARWEMRCTLRGDYARIKRVLVKWKRAVPGLVLQSLQISRTDSLAGEVEAKLVFVVLLVPESDAKKTGAPT